MHAADLITADIAPLKPGDPVAVALDRMDEAKVGHLPVVEGGRLVGLVKESGLADINDPKVTAEAVMDRVEVPFVRGGQHIYDVMKLLVERALTVVPVLDMEGKYLGMVNEHEALRRLAEVTNVREPGSVIVLEMNQTDYSLQEIARIVEGNDAKVLSVYCHTVQDSVQLEVTLKINREDISDILQTFDRFQYQVKTTFQGSLLHEDLRGRFDELMRIINQ
jgi:acetoin utilization protein AcuB